MKLAMNMIRQYADIPVTPEEYTQRMIMSGTAVEGAEDMVDITATYDKTTYLPKNTMTREGYVFYHWTATINGRIVTFEDEEGIRNLTTVDGQIITLTAVWTPKPHRVTFEGGAGTIGGIANPQDV